MRAEFCSFIQSPDALEGALISSNYSTERTPITALLFEAKRNVVLPIVRIGNEPRQIEDENEEERARKAGRSLQE